MIRTHETAPVPERVFLVGLESETVSKIEAASLLAELGGLAASLGLATAGSAQVRLRGRSAALVLGSGKAAEIAAAARESGADAIVFDQHLTPTQQRNWEELSALRVYTRSELIIRIFGSRARTREAALQVELARLQYSLPRLVHSVEDLSRQRGGRYGTKGSGEQKLELDRRRIERRIHEIKDELKELRKQRDVQRRQRERNDLPSVAIVGYTNAGKSSLLNALANAGVLVEDKLFATLDPTTRRIRLPGGAACLVSDTVGFVRSLPHQLVEAFKATLEEAARANLIIELLDASDPELETRRAATEKVLREIGADATPRICALNKIDLERGAALVESWSERHPGTIAVSAKSGAGLDALLAAVEDKLSGAVPETVLRIPDADYGLVALLRREAGIISQSRDDEATIIRTRLPERLVARFDKYRLCPERAAP